MHMTSIAISFIRPVYSSLLLSFSILPPPPRPPLFPYTTLFRSTARVASIMENTNLSKQQQVSEIMRQMLTQAQTAGNLLLLGKDRKSGSAGMPRPISYAVFCLKKKNKQKKEKKREDTYTSMTQD